MISMIGVDIMKKNKEVDDNYRGFNKVFYYAIIFVIACFIGWVYEVIYYLVDDKVWVNRGFLFGPYLPVYGFGAIIMLATLKRFKKNPVLVFLLAMLVTGIVEYIAGALVYQIYHEMWWDYTGLFLNINGYVCLRSVVSFAIGAMLLFYILDPIVCKKIMPINMENKKIILGTILCMIIADIILTLIFRHPL